MFGFNPQHQPFTEEDLGFAELILSLVGFVSFAIGCWALYRGLTLPAEKAALAAQAVWVGPGMIIAGIVMNYRLLLATLNTALIAVQQRQDKK